MKQAIIAFALALILSPSFAFAATPHEQYISFLKEQILALESELIALQSQGTTTPPAVATSTGSVSIPVNPWPAHCYDPDNPHSTAWMNFEDCTSRGG